MTAITEKKINHTVNEIRSLIYVVLIALTIRSLVIELFFVPTGSMKATVLEGEYIFSTKYSYGYSRYSFPFSPNIFSGRVFASAPQRGDIIIFRPPMNMELRYIKRLIGLPGDKIQLIKDVVYINDKPIVRSEIGDYTDEQGQKYNKYKETLPNGVSYTAYKLDQQMEKFTMMANKYSNTEIFYVPKDHYFFLGDNRDCSNDSRVDLGFVPFENFIAKGRVILFSTKELLWVDNGSITERVARIWLWLKSIRFDRMFKSIYYE
nr:signal peptidase I [Candidatus Trichorickettsia mobilis]